MVGMGVTTTTGTGVVLLASGCNAAKTLLEPEETVMTVDQLP